MMLCNDSIWLKAPHAFSVTDTSCPKAGPKGHPPLHGGTKIPSAERHWGCTAQACGCPHPVQEPTGSCPPALGNPHSCDPSSGMGNQDPHICIASPGICSQHWDQSMVLTFTLSILGFSALLLAAVSGQQGKAGPSLSFHTPPLPPRCSSLCSSGFSQCRAGRSLGTGGCGHARS